MRQVLPVMTAALELLKQRLQRAHDGRKHPRLQMRYLLASGRTPTRQDGAQLLGVHRHTIGHGLAIDAVGGLAAWLDGYRPPGQPVSLPPEVLAVLEQALRQPTGLASSAALRPWGQQTYPLEVHDHTRYTMVRQRFKATLKVPRPSHTQHP